MNIAINNNDLSLWKYVYYSYKLGDEFIENIVSINELTNKIFQSPVELANYCINPVEVPKVMNIMSKQSGYGLDKLICIKSIYEIATKGKYTKYDSGILFRFYIPNLGTIGNKIGDKSQNIFIFNSRDIPLGENNFSSRVDKCSAILANVTDSQLRRGLYSEYVSNEGISESRFKRIFSILFTTSGNSGNNANLNSHLTHTFNVHQGQSAIDIVDLREGTYSSKFLFDAFSMDKRLSCINGMIISSDFTKYYVGTYTSNDSNYIISNNEETISTGDGSLMYH